MMRESATQVSPLRGCIEQAAKPSNPSTSEASMTGSYEYQDWVNVLYKQLPRDLQTRLTIKVKLNGPKNRRIAIFNRLTDGRSWCFPAQKDGCITNAAIAQLCAVI
jgi:hypothetical protein